VEEGFAAVLYDWRGIADSTGDFPSSTLRDHSADFAHVAHWTRSRFNTSIGMMHGVGFSLGAAVIGLAMRQGRVLDSVAYLSPASRPSQSMWPRYNNERLLSEVRRHGVVQKPGSSVLLGTSILRSLRDTDLGNRAFDLTVPLLVCHGTDDVRVECSHSRELVKQRVGQSVFRYVEFVGASHSFKPAESCWDDLGHELTLWFDEASQSSAQERCRNSDRMCE
jgi:alpha-beta hydrolase superfamily lysophospholipase